MGLLPATVQNFNCVMKLLISGFPNNPPATLPALGANQIGQETISLQIFGGFR